MFDRLKTALVSSYVGAIAVGWLCAQGILHLANTIAVPVSIWFQQRIQQQQHRELSSLYSAPPRFPFEMALARLLTALFLLLIAFALLRWLYYPAAVELGQEQSPDPEQEA